MRLLFVLLLSALLVHPGLAASPINVTADTFVIDDGNRQATFSGNVVILREGLTVHANKVVVDYGNGGMEDIQSFIASGNVHLKTKDQEASSDQAVFNPSTQMLRMTGNVQVVNATGTLSGPELLLNLGDNTTIFNGGKGGRVTGTFTPQ